MREILYGRQPVRESLRAGRRHFYKLLLAHGLKPTGIVGDILSLARDRNLQIQTIDRRELDNLGGEVNHQGLAAEVSGYPYLDLMTLLEPATEAGVPPFLLFLDHIQDPQNLGSLLRTAEAAGIHGVVIPGRRAAGVTPAAVRASAGAAEHVCLAQVTNMVQAMERLKASGVWFAGLEAVPNAPYYTQADLTGPLGLVIGSEGRGLARLVRETCDFLIRLPMDGQVESLNAAIAGGIALYEARRQREFASTREDREPTAGPAG
jgi:23S rRNA (guanosine2251-2'-O)-methyltransferase